MSTKMYELAREEYAKIGVDTEAAIETLKNIPVSIHCWQGDDVVGFDGAGKASGGIQTTGNYPGRARTPEELMADIKYAFDLMPGKKRLNLHASYAILGDDLGKVDRDAYLPKHFEPWVKFAKEIGLDGIDFNPTNFSHSMVKDGLTLSSPDEKVRKFWIDHCIACLKIGEYFAKEMGSPCCINIWIPDGLKDVPATASVPVSASATPLTPSSLAATTESLSRSALRARSSVSALRATPPVTTSSTRTMPLQEASAASLTTVTITPPRWSATRSPLSLRSMTPSFST